MSKDTQRISIAIVEPFPIIAKGLEQIFNEMKDFKVVLVISGECSYFAERVKTKTPDILLINPTILDFKKRTQIEDLMLQMSCKYVVALATGCVDNQMTRRYHAVVDISDTAERISDKLKRLIDNDKSENENNELSQREQEILVCVAKGMMNKEIANRYHLSIHTVITHRKNIIKKIGIKSVSGLTVFAILNNLIGIEEVK